MKSRGAVIQFQHGVKGLGKEGTVELVDECDSLVLDAADMFISKRAKVGTLIGFTATPLKASTTSSERDLVDFLGIFVHDSAIPVMLELSEELTPISLEAFFDLGITTAARLVYVGRTDREMARMTLS